MTPRKKKTTPRKKSTPKPKFDQVVAKKVACLKCGSTDRSEYYGVVTVPLQASIDRDGNEYNTIKKKRTSCLNCGQYRIESYRENIIAK